MPSIEDNYITVGRSVALVLSKVTENVFPLGLVVLVSYKRSQVDEGCKQR